MYIFVLIVHILVSLVLIAVILLQAGRGGIAESFGGGTTQSLFGTRTATLLTRATGVCAVIFILTSLSLTVLSGHRSRSLMERIAAPQAATPTTSGPSAPIVPLPITSEAAPADASAPAAAGVPPVALPDAGASVEDAAVSTDAPVEAAPQPPLGQ